MDTTALLPTQAPSPSGGFGTPAIAKRPNVFEGAKHTTGIKRCNDQPRSSKPWIAAITAFKLADIDLGTAHMIRQPALAQTRFFPQFLQMHSDHREQERMISGGLHAAIGLSRKNIINRACNAPIIQRPHDLSRSRQQDVCSPTALNMGDQGLAHVCGIRQSNLCEARLFSKILKLHGHRPLSSTRKILPRYLACQYFSSLAGQYGSIKLHQ